MKKGEKEPRDHKYCSVCNQPYGSINCRVTSGGVNRCLRCHGEYKKNKQQSLLQ